MCIRDSSENTFAPNDTLTRAEAAVIFNRLVPSYGMYGTDEVADFDDFTELEMCIRDRSNMPAMPPTSVAIPVATTTPTALP